MRCYTAESTPGRPRGQSRRSIDLRALGVRIRLLDENEGWTRFLELELDDPMALVELQMVSMAA